MVHVGACPLQMTSVLFNLQVRVALPFKLYPMSQLYVALWPNVVPPTTLPFVGFDNAPQS